MEMPARKWNGPASRARIVAAAEALFAERGFEGTSVRDIGRAVEMSNPSLLHHFPTKRRLYAAVLERIAASLDELAAATEAAPGGSRGQLRALVEGFLRWHVANPGYGRLVVRELADNTGRAETAGRWYLAAPVRRMAAVVAAGQTAGAVRPGDPMLLLFHAIGGLSYTAVALPTLAGIAGDGQAAVEARFVEQAWPMVAGALLIDPDGKDEPYAA